MGLTRRRWTGVLVTVVAVAVAVALALGAFADPLATWATRRALRGLDGYRADIDSVDVRLADLTYAVDGLRVAPERAGSLVTALDVEHGEVSLAWRPLLRGHVVVRVKVDSPVVRLVKERAATGNPFRVRAVAFPDWFPTIRIARLEVRGGELLWTDATGSPRPTLRLDGVEGTVEGLATDAAAARDESTTLELSARVQGSGTLRANVESEPGEERLTFRGTAALEGLELTEVADLIRARSGFEPEGGSFHATVDVRGQAGEISGQVRSVVESPDLSGEGEGLVDAAKGLAADALIGAYTGDVRGADEPAIAGTIPIRGRVRGAARAIPTFLSIASTALARGLSSALSVPPGTDRTIHVVENTQEGGG